MFWIKRAVEQIIGAKAGSHAFMVRDLFLITVCSASLNSAVRRFQIKKMRFSIPPELVPKLRELQAQSRQFYIDKIVESEDAVVMTLGLGDAMYLALDGRVIVDEWNYPDEDTPTREAKDAKEMFTAIVIGAKRFNAPELLSLLPSRSETAVDCAACECRGWIRFGLDIHGKPIDFVCSDCGGVGWIDNDEQVS